MLTSAKASEAASILGVELEGLTPAVLRKAYYAKAKACHPDHHGTKHLAQWARVSWANEVMLLYLKQSPPPEHSLALENACRACGGTGRAHVRRTTKFGKPMTVQCAICRGLGIVHKAEEPSHD